jgi:hypothetical protein
MNPLSDRERESLEEIVVATRSLIEACDKRLTTAGYHAIEMQADRVRAALASLGEP